MLGITLALETIARDLWVKTYITFQKKACPCQKGLFERIPTS